MPGTPGLVGSSPTNVAEVIPVVDVVAKSSAVSVSTAPELPDSIAIKPSGLFVENNKVGGAAFARLAPAEPTNAVPSAAPPNASTATRGRRLKSGTVATVFTTTLTSHSRSFGLDAIPFS